MTLKPQMEAAILPETLAVAPASNTATIPGQEASSGTSDDEATARKPSDTEQRVITRLAANDDDASGVKGLSGDLKRGRREFQIAAFISILWIALLTSDGIIAGRSLSIRALLQPEGASFLILAVIPIALFFICAELLRQARRAHVYAEGLTSALDSLARPDERLQEQVMSLSLSIRREVASISDGVERAIGRASELEGQIRSEILRLEKAYRDGELRVSSVLTQLRHERSALTGHADSAVEAISKVRNALSEHVEFECTKIFKSLDDASSRFEEMISRCSADMGAMLETKRGHLYFDVERGAQQIVAAMEAHVQVGGDRLLEDIRTEFKSYREATSSLTAQLVEQVGEVSDTSRVQLVRAATDAARMYEAELAEACRNLTEVGQTVGDDLIAKKTGLVEAIRDAASDLVSQTRDAMRDDFSSELKGEFEILRHSINDGSSSFSENARQIQKEVEELKSSLDRVLTSGEAARLVLTQALKSSLDEGLRSFSAEARAANEGFEERSQKSFDVIRTDVAEKIATQQEALERFLTSSVSAQSGMILQRLNYLHSLLFDEKTGLTVHLRNSHATSSDEIDSFGRELREDLEKRLSELKERFDLVLNNLGLIREDIGASSTAIAVLHHGVARASQEYGASVETLQDDIQAFGKLAASISAAVYQLERPPGVTETVGAEYTPARAVLPKLPNYNQVRASSGRPGRLSDLLARSSKDP